MSTYEQAERVRDMIADRLLDGVRVVSVGIKNDGADYRVGVTATRPVNLPSLPRDLRDVVVNVVMTAGPARRHIVSRSASEPSGPRLGAIRGWLHRSDKGYGNHTE